MSRDSTISLLGSLACHGIILFGITVTLAGPTLLTPKQPRDYLEVTLAASAPEPAAAAAVAPPPPPTPPVTPLPPPQPVPPPPVKEPEPPPPPPKVEAMKLPEPPPPAPAPQPVLKPVAQPAPTPPSPPPQVVAVAAPSAAAATTNVGATFNPAATARSVASPGDKYQSVSHPFYKKKNDLRYPERAQKLGLEGVVVLTLYINELGLLDKIEVKESSGHKLLDDAAVANERASRFSPMYQDNRPVACKAEVPYRFELTTGPKRKTL